ncbi:MAG TPA: YkgJ family cysteine cluster protein [Candidatus Thermoplasmatota archaeon]|nr:YkgJ family cysteine cluster protein [Candidatus Thermoplasmatota archaeon]
MAVPVFSCTGCARCCRNLVDSASREVPVEESAALARQGLYPMPREGGLQVWPWERRRMLAAAREAGVPMRFRPALAAVGDVAEGRRAVVVVWELVGNECPLVTADDRCGAYGDRPAICRAYPLLVRGRAFVVSSLCPGHVMPTLPSQLPVAYGASHRAAAAAARYPALASSWLAFLEDAGRAAWSRDLGAADVAGLPTVDLLDLLEREGVTSQADVEARCAELGVAYG